MTSDEPDGFAGELVITVTASATHPPDVLLDEQGNPVLDERGQPVRRDTT